MQPKNKIERMAILQACMLLAASATAETPTDQPYIYDYYDNGVSASEYVTNYHGEAYNGPHIPNASSIVKIQAEDFDNGGEGVAWSFKNHKNNNYRKDVTGVAINNFGSGHVIGNVSAGDWLCYTLEVEDDGEYELVIHCSSDNVKEFYYEVDGKAAGSILYTPGQGWDNYSDVTNHGIQLSEGRHILRWIPSNSMNVDYFTLEHVGNYVAPIDGGMNFQYPRYGTYTTNPLFTDMTSPMWGCGFTSPMYTADPSAHVWDIDGRDVLYVYASHDLSPAQGCDHMDRYHIFSTEDLVHWIDHGEIMNATTSNTYTGTEGPGLMWAPDCAYNSRDGLYYFVYPHKIKGTAEELGIPDPQGDSDGYLWGHFLATSENPAGPWRCLGYIKGIPSTIDPCIFVDDDGKAYIYTSGAGQGCWGCKLKDDNWLELDGAMTPMKGIDGTTKGGFDDFHEAPWMFKKDGTYYLCHSDNNSGNNRLRYSTASNPLGPFTPQGVFMNPHGHDTAHGSVLEFKGKWYSFYHTADFSGHGALRSVCFDELTFSADGRINMVNVWGQPYSGSAIEVSKASPVTINACEYNNGGNAKGFYKRDGSTPERQGAVTLDNEEWLRFSIDVKESGRYAVTVSGKSMSGNCKILVNIDGQRKTGENGIDFPSDADELYIYPVALDAGQQYIELRVKNGTMSIDSFTLGDGQVLIPGTIQAEDLDADDYLFQDTNAAENQNSYRSDVHVAFGSFSGGTNIGNTSSGDYYCYTFNCTEAGTYDIVSYLCVNAQNSQYQILMDGKLIKDEKISGDSWSNYFTRTASGVELTGGVHKMRFNVVRGPMNIDKFDFKRTGNLSGIESITAYLPSIEDRKVDVYSIDGRLLRRQAIRENALDGLDRGLYIVAGEKVAKTN